MSSDATIALSPESPLLRFVALQSFLANRQSKMTGAHCQSCSASNGKLRMIDAAPQRGFWRFVTLSYSFEGEGFCGTPSPEKLEWLKLLGWVEHDNFFLGRSPKNYRACLPARQAQRSGAKPIAFRWSRDIIFASSCEILTYSF